MSRNHFDNRVPKKKKQTTQSAGWSYTEKKVYRSNLLLSNVLLTFFGKAENKQKKKRKRYALARLICSHSNLIAFLVHRLRIYKYCIQEIREVVCLVTLFLCPDFNFKHQPFSGSVSLWFEKCSSAAAILIKQYTNLYTQTL